MPARFAAIGDPGAGIDDAVGSLEALLELSQRHEAEGEGDAPWPPNYAKQAGEPPRVQPSKARRPKSEYEPGRGEGGGPPPEVAAERAAAVAAGDPNAGLPTEWEGTRPTPTGRRKSTIPVIEISRAASKAEALEGLDRWKVRHPEAAAALEVSDVLVDGMRGRSSLWYRVRVNLTHVPEADRPAQEPLDPDYDPWAGYDIEAWQAQTNRKRTPTGRKPKAQPRNRPGRRPPPTARRVTRDEFQALLDRAAAGWADGDAAAVGDCFAEDVEYLDPFLYRFDRRADLLPFFEPPPGGHRVTWHSVIWDDEAQTAAVEYIVRGPPPLPRGGHRPSRTRTAGSRSGASGSTSTTPRTGTRGSWGPAADPSLLASIDHVQLGMPAGGEDAARAFYGGVLGLREVAKPRRAGRPGRRLVRRSGGRDPPGRRGGLPGLRRRRTRPSSSTTSRSVRERLADGRRRRPIEDDSGLPIARCYVRDPVRQPARARRCRRRRLQRPPRTRREPRLTSRLSSGSRPEGGRGGRVGY